ncbi:MAG: chitobiase/beta-hexosaminidase C-terminal domain-containing protein, partial [Candidatus Hydrogenedentes bacterium]|nr:chitobiase/beta-hexosaminidase C-terminal domain-containing protein [Candidatus Hydrogenedentota bacterium]
LTILETEAGAVQVSPAGLSDTVVFGNRLVEYGPLTEVTLTAVPESASFDFVQWEGDVPEADWFNPTVTFTITENISVRAVFTATIFEITDIAPDHAWFFGGVVANIRGSGFMPGSTQLRFFGSLVDPIAVTPTEIWFAVPPLPAAPVAQTLLVDVAVINPPYTVEFSRIITFMYLRYETAGNVTTTAFRYNGTALDTAVALGASLSQASLILPPPEQNIPQAYGLIRAAKDPSLLEADQIGMGTPVATAWNFAIHLYDTTVMDVGLNTGASVYSEITNWTYARSEVSVPGQLQFTVDGTGLIAEAIRNDVMMWSVDTRYDYGEDVTTLVSPLNTDYQSSLEQLEVTPVVTPDSPAGTMPVTTVVARLYDLTAFGLRTGVPSLPEAFLAAATISGAASGPASGGTQFTINAPLGGLAWVTVGFGENITESTPASATQVATVVDNGASEFSAIVHSPAWVRNEGATVDVAVYLNSNLGQPVVIFGSAFTYLASMQPAKPVFSPPPGDYAGPVSISCATNGAAIRYTLDGNEPAQTSPIYDEPITLTGTTTIAAKAFKAGLAPSETAYAHYVYSEMPRASFNASPVSGPAPLAVTFTDASSSGASAITTWHWDMGDSESTFYNPQPTLDHTYITPGIYSVTLEVTNEAGADAMTRTSFIRVYGSAGGADSDGDGLSDSAETSVYHTSPYNPDSDGDGIDDGWEVLYGLDPLVADADLDADDDGWTNLEEYQHGTNPRDPLSPASVFYVATDGDDILGDGSSSSPWQTIGRATELLEGTQAHPVLVRVYPGMYEEGQLALSPWLTVAGIEMAAEEVVQFVGAVFAAEGAGLKNLTLLEPESQIETPLLSLDAPMIVQNVAFAGVAARSATGIIATGANEASLVEGCTFSSLETGIQIHGGAPVIRRCMFFDISGSAITVSDTEPKAGTLVISSADNPNSGFNTFILSTIGAGDAVANDSAQQLIMENNDWDTNVEAEIAARVTGDTDFIPYLGKGAGVGAASAHCRLWDADTQQPILNGSVQLGPGTFSPVTKNTAGVYSFACLSPGPYTFDVAAPGYQAVTQSKSIEAGTSEMLLFTLVKPAPNDDDGGGGCFGGKIERLANTPRAQSQTRTASLPLILAAITILAAAAIIRKPPPV